MCHKSFSIPVLCLVLRQQRSTEMLSLRKLEAVSTILLFVASICESEMRIQDADKEGSRRGLKEVPVERLDCQESLCVGLEYPSALEVAFFGENTAEKLKDYKALIIHSSRLMNLPRNVFQSLPQLVEFDVLESEVQHIERECFRGSQNLKILNLGGNSIKELERNTFDLSTELEELNLSDNQLEELPRGVFLPLKKLQKLNLSNNQLKIVSLDVFTHLNALQTVNLDSNKLKELPRGLFRPLRLLSARNNLLEQISMNTFESIEHLILSDNPHLTRLRLKGDIQELQASNCALKSVILDGRIIRLRLDNNLQLEDVKITQPQALEQLDLANTNLLSLDFLSKATGLMDLDLSGIDKLKDTPDLWKSKHLERLSITYPMDMLPKLKDLNYLEIQQEKLREIYIKDVDYDFFVKEDGIKCDHLMELLSDKELAKDVTFWEEDSTLLCGKH
ncbi:leucine-rich repeat-containing protein 15 [Drosophila pseudoobscura]|uniref:Leucine-rich repeat-containing protein 15 n=1 Tax=Drosophila pseudoobscura pseudoobscura TaxID=46245 RepID=A0A6I8VPT0_DROPS|nr:leucine-rich repeat-containing protein 15 [Drosophila pseudoobscura]